MVTDVVVDTLAVVIVKPHWVAPAPTVTLDGTAATPGLLLDSDTTAPPAGAAPDSETIPDVPLPPATLDGLMVRPVKVTPALAGVIVSVAERVSPL